MLKYDYLITGGAGFIGSNFIKYMFSKYGTKISILNFDLLTYAGNLNNLKDIENNSNYKFVRGDISNRNDLEELFKNYCFDYVINFAAESHVDRSIIDCTPFIKTNILGTQNLLDYSKKYNVKKYLQISTDEVYGSLGKEGYFTENSNIMPNSPYAASKASADLLVRAYIKTYNFPAIITRCSNNYGPYQFPEKLIPLMITNIINKKELPVYGTGENVRDWIHVYDHCNALDLVLHKGKIGEVYNIGGQNERKNIEVVILITEIMEKFGYSNGKSLIKFIDDRLGHDFRYAIDISKISNELGFKPQIKFEEGLTNTIKWYLDNQQWITNIINGNYKNYYESFYLPKLKNAKNLL